MFKQLTQKWNKRRIARFLMSVALLALSIKDHDKTLIFISGILLVMSLINISFCGFYGCSTPTKNTKNEICKDQIKEYKPKS